MDTVTPKNNTAVMYNGSSCTGRDNSTVHDYDASFFEALDLTPKFPKLLYQQRSRETFVTIEEDQNSFQQTALTYLNKLRSHPSPVAIEECLTAEGQKILPTPTDTIGRNIETGGNVTFTDLKTYKFPSPPSSDDEGHDGQNKEAFKPAGADRKSDNKRKIPAHEVSTKKLIKTAFTLSTGASTLPTEVFPSTSSAGSSHSPTEVSTFTTTVTEAFNLFDLSVEPIAPNWFTTDTSTTTEEETGSAEQPRYPETGSMGEKKPHRK